MKTIKSHLNGIIFDMDGTIIDTESIWENATAELLRSHGVDPIKVAQEKQDVFDKMVGIGLHDTMELIREHLDLAHLRTEDMQKQVVRIAKEMFNEEIQFIHGFADFHKKITDAGIPISIATNCDAESLEQLVKKMSFDKHFGEHIYCVAHVEKPKPHPDLFLLAADKIGADPNKCVVFEDSLWGFKAADAAQMKCIAVKNKKNENFFANHTHGHIESYHDAEEVVKAIVKKHFMENQ